MCDVDCVGGTQTQTWELSAPLCNQLDSKYKFVAFVTIFFDKNC